MYKDATNMHKLALQDKHHDVVDGTIGVLLDDDKNLIYSKVFDEEMNKLNTNKYNYAPVSGGNAYCEAIKTYFNIPAGYTIVATPGATGAAHGALAMTTPGDTTMANLKEVEAIMGGAGARVQR